MNFFKSIANLFRGGGGPSLDKRYLTIYVLSRRCNEPISGQVDLLNELSRSDDAGYAWYTRKVLHTTGERRCFSQVEISLFFNQDKQIISHEVEGGRWLTSEEYTTELARFNAPPPEEDDASENASENAMETTATEATSASTPTSLTEGEKPTTTKENDHA
jgi:hypothetical protein